MNQWAGCNKNSTDSGEPTWTWQGGELTFYTQDADDTCLGGAMEALFMPEGPDVPHEFEYPIWVPSYEELPASYEIDLREPFVEMPVTLTEGNNGDLILTGSVMEDVELGYISYGDCTVTMTVDAILTPTGPTSLKAKATIAISDAAGEDQRCPVFSSDPCDVFLTITAE